MDNSNQSSSFSIGAAAGLAAGATLDVVLIVFIVWLITHRRQKALRKAQAKDLEMARIQKGHWREIKASRSKSVKRKVMEWKDQPSTHGSRSHKSFTSPFSPVDNPVELPSPCVLPAELHAPCADPNEMSTEKPPKSTPKSQLSRASSILSMYFSALSSPRKSLVNTYRRDKVAKSLVEKPESV